MFVQVLNNDIIIIIIITTKLQSDEREAGQCLNDRESRLVGPTTVRTLLNSSFTFLPHSSSTPYLIQPFSNFAKYYASKVVQTCQSGDGKQRSHVQKPIQAVE